MLLNPDGTPVFDVADGMRFFIPELFQEERRNCTISWMEKLRLRSFLQGAGDGTPRRQRGRFELLTRDFTRIAAVIVAVTVVLFGLFYIFSSYFLKNIIDPIHNTVEGMRLVEEGRLDVHVVPVGQAELQCHDPFLQPHDEAAEAADAGERGEEQQKKHEAEIRALQSQINPHFGKFLKIPSALSRAGLQDMRAIARMAGGIKLRFCPARSGAMSVSIP